MRILAFCCLLFSLPLSAAPLSITIERNGFKEPLEIAIAPREEGMPPQWTATKKLPAGSKSIAFTGLTPGLYTILVRGPQPLQRLSAKANVGSGTNTVRLSIPKSTAALQVLLGDAPLPRAGVAFTHDELRWDTELTTDDEGRFTGALWEPGTYGVRVRPGHAAAPHVAELTLATTPIRIAVPDRHITGRVAGEDGRPVAGALLTLRTENEEGSLTLYSQSAPDGRFEFFGVRAGHQSIAVRAATFLQSDARFELRGDSETRAVELTLSRGTQRTVRVVGERGDGLANASLFTACDGSVRSASTTDAEGRGTVAVPLSGSCAVYAVPREGSLGVAQVGGSGDLLIRVRGGASSLNLTLKSEAGDVFENLWLMMRIDGVVVPPAVARQLTTRGLSLKTGDDGRISLGRIPPGTYEFWPYRNEAEGQMIYEVAESFAAPISVNVLTGENNATVKFKAKR